MRFIAVWLWASWLSSLNLYCFIHRLKIMFILYVKIKQLTEWMLLIFSMTFWSIHDSHHCLLSPSPNFLLKLLPSLDQSAPPFIKLFYHLPGVAITWVPHVSLERPTVCELARVRGFMITQRRLNSPSVLNSQCFFLTSSFDYLVTSEPQQSTVLFISSPTGSPSPLTYFFSFSQRKF